MRRGFQNLSKQSAKTGDIGSDEVLGGIQQLVCGEISKIDADLEIRMLLHEVHAIQERGMASLLRQPESRCLGRDVHSQLSPEPSSGPQRREWRKRRRGMNVRGSGRPG